MRMNKTNNTPELEHTEIIALELLMNSDATYCHYNNLIVIKDTGNDRFILYTTSIKEIYASFEYVKNRLKLIDIKYYNKNVEKVKKTIDL